ncbi:MAG: NUDIX hydrolase, partial [Oscillospiraceae bacterium]
KRELEEEVGVTAKNYFSLGEMYPTVGYCSEIIYIYGATDLTCTAVHPDEDEFLTIEKFPLQTAVDMVLNGEIKDGKTICGILKLQAYLAKNNL